VSAGGRRRLEPWPIGLAAALLVMIAISVGFYCVARAHPDRVVAHETDSPRPAR
jgi:hypothetical protein